MLVGCLGSGETGKKEEDSEITGEDVEENHAFCREEQQFAGHEWDEDVGMYYAKARWYDAVTGRFVSVDPIKDGANWYVYCSNNPISWIDPSGMLSDPASIPTLDDITAFLELIDICTKISLADAQAPIGELIALGIYVVGITIIDIELTIELIETNKKVKIAKENFEYARQQLQETLPAGFTVNETGKILNSNGNIVSIEEVMADAAAEKKQRELNMQKGNILPEGYYVDVNGDVRDSDGNLIGDQNDAWNDYNNSGGEAKIVYIYSKETKSGKMLSAEQAAQDWEDFLGPNQTNINPVTGKVEPDRIFSADGTRSIRFGKHEINSPQRLHHYHKETWIFDKSTNTWNVTNELQRYR